MHTASRSAPALCFVVEFGFWTFLTFRSRACILQTVDYSTETLDDRLTAVEKDLAELKHLLAADKSQRAAAWWEKMFGSFADSEGFEEAVQLGREYRESLRPKDDGKPR